MTGMMVLKGQFAIMLILMVMRFLILGAILNIQESQ